MTDSRHSSISSERSSSISSESGAPFSATASAPAPEISPLTAKDLHNVPANEADVRRTSVELDAPPRASRGKRLSFGGGNDGHGTPLFSNLHASKSRHMYDGYEDMKPKAGFVESAFRRWVGADHAKAATEGGVGVHK